MSRRPRRTPLDDSVARSGQDDNTPELAVGAMRAAFVSTRPVFHAWRARASEMWEV